MNNSNALTMSNSGSRIFSIRFVPKSLTRSLAIPNLSFVEIWVLRVLLPHSAFIFSSSIWDFLSSIPPKPALSCLSLKKPLSLVILLINSSLLASTSGLPSVLTKSFAFAFALSKASFIPNFSPKAPNPNLDKALDNDLTVAPVIPKAFS